MHKLIIISTIVSFIGGTIINIDGGETHSTRWGFFILGGGVALYLMALAIYFGMILN